MRLRASLTRYSGASPIRDRFGLKIVFRKASSARTGETLCEIACSNDLNHC
jgi:hypothetical protein